ncbi:Hypothetical predicted protein, partial [Pelobates cultripes]
MGRRSKKQRADPGISCRDIGSLFRQPQHSVQPKMVPTAAYSTALSEAESTPEDDFPAT